VRHPIYSAALFWFLGVSLTLGPLWGLLVVAATVMFVLVWRLLDEENLLTKDLMSYTEYRNKVKYHLIPFVW